MLSIVLHSTRCTAVERFINWFCTAQTGNMQEGLRTSEPVLVWLYDILLVWLLGCLVFKSCSVQCFEVQGVSAC